MSFFQPLGGKVSYDDYISSVLSGNSAPGRRHGKTGRVYTSYVVDSNKARALEEAAAFVGVRVDPGTFRED